MPVSFVFPPRDGCTMNGKSPRSPIKGAVRCSPVAPVRIHGWRVEVEAEKADARIEVEGKLDGEGKRGGRQRRLEEGTKAR